MRLTGENNKSAKRYVDWLEKGVFNALEHRYLSDVLLEIYAPQNETLCSDIKQGDVQTLGVKPKKGRLIEMYTFSVTYGDFGVKLLMVDKADKKNQESINRPTIKNSTIDVLRSLLFKTRALLPLPKNCVIAVRVR